MNLYVSQSLDIIEIRITEQEQTRNGSTNYIETFHDRNHTYLKSQSSCNNNRILYTMICLCVNGKLEIPQKKSEEYNFYKQTTWIQGLAG